MKATNRRSTLTRSSINTANISEFFAAIFTEDKTMLAIICSVAIAMLGGIFRE
jgi:hypothetical protein